MDLSLEHQSKVYSYYLKQPVEPGSAYVSIIPSDIRGSDDMFPSLGFFLSKDGTDLMFMDYSGGGGSSPAKAKQLVGDCLKFMVLVDPKIKSHKHALYHYHDVIKDAEIEYTADVRQAVRTKKMPEIHYREDLFDFELDYWADYDIFDQQLYDEYVYGSDGVQGSKGVYFESTEERPIFIYDMDTYMDACQIYNPLVGPDEKHLKWRLYLAQESVTQTYHTTLPDEADTLIITKSRKDKMVINNCGFEADAVFAESSRNRLLSKYWEYVDRFGEVFILFDGDEGGIKGAMSLLYWVRELDPESNWKIINSLYDDKRLIDKDPAGIVKQYGTEKLEKMLRKIIR